MSKKRQRGKTNHFIFFIIGIFAVTVAGFKSDWTNDFWVSLLTNIGSGLIAVSLVFSVDVFLWEEDNRRRDEEGNRNSSPDSQRSSPPLDSHGPSSHPMANENSQWIEQEMMYRKIWQQAYKEAYKEFQQLQAQEDALRAQEELQKIRNYSHPHGDNSPRGRG